MQLEYVHRGQTYLTASNSQLRYFCHFFNSRRDGENNGFLAGVPLLPHPWRVVSRPNSLPFPFERLPRRLRETGHTGRAHPSCSVLATKSSSRYEISRKYHVNEDRPLVLKQNLSPSRSIVEGNGGGMRSFGRMI